MFSAVKASESDSFALGATTGTGNEKRRTLRKSSENPENEVVLRKLLLERREGEGE